MEVGAILPLLRDVFGTRVCVQHSQLLKARPDYWVWEAVLARPAQHVVIKVAGPGAQYACAFERVAAIHRLAREQAGLPVADVLAADSTCRRWPWRYFIKSWLDGQLWADVAGQKAEQAGPDHLHAARATLGQGVARMHQIRFAGFGEIGGDGVAGCVPAACMPAATMPAAYMPAVSMPVGSLEGLRRHACAILPDPRGLDFFLQALEPRAGLFQGNESSLCHEDLHGYNLLVRPTDDGMKLCAILDFEKAWAGHAEADLARMDLWQMTGPAFWQAYRQAGGPLTEAYEARRPLLQLLWCLEFAQNTPEHLETTRAVCQELGIPAVKRFAPLQTQE